MHAGTFQAQPTETKACLICTLRQGWAAGLSLIDPLPQATSLTRTLESPPGLLHRRRRTPSRRTSLKPLSRGFDAFPSKCVCKDYPFLDSTIVMLHSRYLFFQVHHSLSLSLDHLDLCLLRLNARIQPRTPPFSLLREPLLSLTS